MSKPKQDPSQETLSPLLTLQLCLVITSFGRGQQITVVGVSRREVVLGRFGWNRSSHGSRNTKDKGGSSGNGHSRAASVASSWRNGENGGSGDVYKHQGGKVLGTSSGSRPGHQVWEVDNDD